MLRLRGWSGGQADARDQPVTMGRCTSDEDLSALRYVSSDAQVDATSSSEVDRGACTFSLLSVWDRK